MEQSLGELAHFLQDSNVAFVLSAILALCNCFFGYRLMRVWVALAGFAVGAAFGGWLLFTLTEIALFALIAALVLGVLCAVLASKVYLAGVFLLCGGVTYFTLAALFGTSGGRFAIYLVVAVVVGVLAVNFVRPAVILSTAIGGGTQGVELVFALCGVVNQPVQLVVGALVALGGMVLQFSTTKKGGRKRR